MEKGMKTQRRRSVCRELVSVKRKKREELPMIPDEQMDR